jgi:hypothetical protein
MLQALAGLVVDRDGTGDEVGRHMWHHSQHPGVICHEFLVC